MSALRSTSLGRKSPISLNATGAGALDGGPAVLKSGLLLKQGALVRSWRERWFVLHADRLAYYDPADWDGTRSTGKPRGTLLLSDVVGVTALRSRGAFQVSVVGTNSTGSSRSDDRDFYLVAASDSDRCGAARRASMIGQFIVDTVAG